MNIINENESDHPHRTGIGSDRGGGMYDSGAESGKSGRKGLPESLNLRTATDKSLVSDGR
jgi:hypothetical protein